MTNPMFQMSNEQLLDMVTPATAYEFMRRQTVAQQEAAKSAETTAIYTRRNAHFMLVSVVVLALSSIGTFALNLLTYGR